MIRILQTHYRPLRSLCFMKHIPMLIIKSLTHQPEVAEWVRRISAVVVLTACSFLSGCQSDGPRNPVYDPPVLDSAMSQSVTNISNSIILREGDVVKVTFPSAGNLNTVQPIRRDGKITLQMVGEMTAAGLTPMQLEAEVIRLYAPQILTKEVTVSVESSSFPVFVMGAVVKPGKFLADRPLTAFEAIMEAGGFDNSRANKKNVLVIRHENGGVKNFKLNLKNALLGKPTEPFSIKPHDIIYVPEKFSFF